MKKDLKSMAKFVDNEAKKQMKKIPKAEEITVARDNLKKYSTKKAEKFTFTVGEMNAYLG